MLSTSLSQLWVHCCVLETSIAWSRSSLHAYCRICRRKSDGEHMLLCDACDRGHHMYCLKPPVKVSICYTAVFRYHYIQFLLRSEYINIWELFFISNNYVKSVFLLLFVTHTTLICYLLTYGSLFAITKWFSVCNYKISYFLSDHSVLVAVVLVLCGFLQTVPEGDWFCPSCRPKEILPRTPRKSFTELSSVEDSESEDELTRESM